jgi:hypothetical protein
MGALLTRLSAPPSNRSQERVEHQVPVNAMVRPETKLGKVKRQLLAADLNVRRAHAVFEQMPEAFDAVGRVRLASAVIVVGPFLRAVLDRAVNEASPVSKA